MHFRQLAGASEGWGFVPFAADTLGIEPKCVT
jgi:hypothetical protein